MPGLPYGNAVGAIINGEGAAAFRHLIESGRSRELRAVADRTGGYVAYATLAVDSAYRTASVCRAYSWPKTFLHRLDSLN